MAQEMGLILNISAKKSNELASMKIIEICMRATIRRLVINGSYAPVNDDQDEEKLIIQIMSSGLNQAMFLISLIGTKDLPF